MGDRSPKGYKERLDAFGETPSSNECTAPHHATSRLFSYRIAFASIPIINLSFLSSHRSSAIITPSRLFAYLPGCALLSSNHDRLNFFL